MTAPPCMSRHPEKNNKLYYIDWYLLRHIKW
jgi:hypothetical protein